MVPFSFIAFLNIFDFTSEIIFFYCKLIDHSLIIMEYTVYAICCGDLYHKVLDKNCDESHLGYYLIFIYHLYE